MKRDWNDFLFGDVGKKIKSIARFNTWFWIIASVLGGTVMFFVGLSDGDFLMMLLAPIVVVVGVLLAWLSNLLLYGFGELIDNTTGLHQTLCNTFNVPVDNNQKPKKAYPAQKPQKPQKATPETESIPIIIKRNEINAKSYENAAELADESFFDVVCPKCQEALFFPKGTATANCPWCDSFLKFQ